MPGRPLPRAPARAARASIAAAALLYYACSGSVAGPAGPSGGSIGEAPGDAPSRPVESGQAPLVCPDLGQVGAPVPMRRLTKRQVERSVRDILGVEEALAVSDERILTFASNISTALDANGARAYFDFAERVAAKAELKRCGTASGCLEWLLDEVALRLFRRPLDPDQRARYQALHQQGGADGARWVLAALVQSPSFLYLDEVERDQGELDDYALAARLALVLWGQNPDLPLLARAAQNGLSQAGAIEAEASRLLADPRSQGGMQDFVDQWLDLRRLDDPDARPDLAALGRAALDALRLEPVRFFQRLLARQGALHELLTSAESVRSDALLTLYGDDVESTSADSFTLTSSRRAGILTLPGVVAAHAHAGATSPTLRGYNVLAHFLCAPPPPPPATVSASLPEVSADASARERLEAHFSDDTCGACHRGMDGVGFAFERLDWLGRSRSQDAQGRPIDASASISLVGVPVEVDGAVELMTALDQHPAVADCVAKQWVRYASGVAETSDSRCLIQRMGKQVKEEDGLNQMLLTYLSSAWFRRGRGVQ